MSDRDSSDVLGTLEDSIRLLSAPQPIDDAAVVARSGRLFATPRVSGETVALALLEESSGHVRLLGALLEDIERGEAGTIVLRATFRRSGFWYRWAGAQASLSFDDDHRVATALEVWPGPRNRFVHEVRSDGLVVSGDTGQ
jgi:hypothetical protein